MSLSRMNVVLSLLLAGVVVISVVARRDFGQPNLQIHLGHDMTYSPAYSAYAPNPHLPHGRTMQRPVAGTIARGQLPLHFAATPEDALRAGEELVNPFAADSDEGVAARERGAAAYTTFCVSCHGGGGLGDGQVAKRGYPPPPSLLTGKSVTMKDGQLFHILTYGQNNMPSFAAELTHKRRWELILHIRQLQSQAAASAAASEPSSAEPESEPQP